MNWVKKGLVFNTDGLKDWSRTHAQVPKPFQINENRMRIYYGTRDSKNSTYTSFIDVNPEKPEEIIYIHDTPVMSLGGNNNFDKNGVMAGSFIANGDEIIMYYTGWKNDDTYPYAVSIGAAISTDGGNNFIRISDEPILGKPEEAISCSQPFVIKEKDKWKMWYSSFTGWKKAEGREEAFYVFRYAESEDGYSWKRNEAFKFNMEADAMTNPSVWREGDKLQMLFSFRKGFNFRENPDNSYRIGYADSGNSYDWVRNDDKIGGLGLSESGWDSEMIAYPAVYFFKGKKYLLYNGNGFGRTGFGYAISEGN